MSASLALLKRPPFILASASPRRRDLLAEHDYEFRVEPADVIEVAPPHFSPGETVLYNARLKASALASKYPGNLVVGVDTLVAFEGRIFGKPADMPEAERMLSELNGRAHAVFSGVSLIRRSSGQERAFIEVTQVRFRVLSAEGRRAYLQRIGPLDKAGAYAAQDDNGEIIESVEGSFSNVVGLPMETFGRVIREFYNE
ncbi:MAG: Septum formation protein Maf [Chthoniobacteraceae bacterium]|nr:Septum formation protein Maf [Chthoniobacteraceae bacterium]